MTNERPTSELGTIARLALPMMGAQGGLMLMGVVDSFVVGRVSSLEMAAVSLGNSVAGVIVVFGVGLAMGIEPLVAQALGAGDPRAARRWLWQGLWLSGLVAPLLLVLTLSTGFFYAPFGIGPELAERTSAFVLARLPGILFNCTYATLRSYFSASGRARPVLVAVAIANVTNFLIDLLLVFGLFGLPRLGAVGAGIATSSSWLLMTAILAWVVKLSPIEGPDGPIHGFEAPNKAAILQVARIGWPVGMQVSIEVGIFALVSALIARFGEAQLAGHQTAISLASLSFMTAVGVANATTARVGFWIGANDPARARRTGFTGIGLGAGFMGIVGVGFFVFRAELAELFTPTDPAAQAVAAQLLAIAAVFAIFDGTQVVSAGALRGAGDTHWTFYANLAAHWLLAFPLALYLGNVRGLGTVGYWWALTAGLVGVALILLARFARVRLTATESKA